MSLRYSEKEYKQLLKNNVRLLDHAHSRIVSTNEPLIVGGYASKWSGWVTISGKKYYFRSLWENNYACFLEYEKQRRMIIDWEYEPKRFEFKDQYKKGPYDYLPDFKVITSQGHRWHEVKGFLNSKSKSKITRFEKQFPEEGKVIIIDSTWFRQAKIAAKLIPGWMTLDQAKSLKAEAPSPQTNKR